MNFIVIVVLILLIIAIIALYYYRKRKNYNKLLNSFLLKVKQANSEFERLTAKTKYISNFDKFSYQTTFKKLYSELPFSSLNVLANEGEPKNETLKFKSNFENINSLVDKANNAFIENELNSQKLFFDDIEGKSLDIQQRKSIIIDEDNNIIVAGAGSGKTTTIAGKVKYLISRHNIKPHEILLIAFTSKVADEMRERIKMKMNIDISVNTFHKLGLDIIADSKNERPSIFDPSDREIKELFASFIENAKKMRSIFLS